MRAARFTALLAGAVLLASTTLPAVKVGEPAPVFTGTDTKGHSHTLDAYKGKFVVLEWHNQGCPYVRKHYGSGNMQRLQKEWTEKGVVWLTVISSAPGTQGHVTAAQADQFVADQHASPTAVLLDPTGVIGRAYDAKTTPHMFVIDPQGRLIYNGAIDDQPTTDLADVPTAKNYVSQALSESMAGKPVSVPTSRPYGCSVKYGT